jgi:hypothetical protein
MKLVRPSSRLGVPAALENVVVEAVLVVEGVGRVVVVDRVQRGITQVVELVRSVWLAALEHLHVVEADG